MVWNIKKVKCHRGIKEKNVLFVKTLHCDMFHVQFVNGIHGNVLNCLGRKYSRMNLSDNNAAVTTYLFFIYSKASSYAALVPRKNRAS